jgi:glycerate kinase
VSRVVVAPDSFKGSLDAVDVAAAIARGWHDERAGDDVVELPQADGGEGTLAAIAAAVPNAVLRSAGRVTGPDGRPVEGLWVELPDGTAVVELAQCSGLPLMADLNPLGATTRPLGEVVGAALEAGAISLIIGLGGSASTDGGRGALDALAGVSPPSRGVRLLTDVTAPLLGPTGAAAVFGPQKGASASDIRILERRLERFASQFDADPATPGAGAAGGTAFGFKAAWGATIESGSAAIARLTGLDAALADADILITGEGRYDATSMTGKVVGNALGLADGAGIRAVVVAGSFGIPPVSPAGRAVEGASLADLAGSTKAAIADPRRWLREAGRVAAG